MLPLSTPTTKILLRVVQAGHGEEPTQNDPYHGDEVQ